MLKKAIFLCLFLSAFAASPAVAQSSLRVAWSSYTRNGDVSTTMDTMSASIFSGILGAHDVRILWDGRTQTLDVLRDRAAISDLVATDNGDQMAFQGQWNGTEYEVTGSITADPNGYLIVEYQELVDAGLRAVVVPGVGVIIAPTCVCQGTGTLRGCRNIECDDYGTQCSTQPGAATAYCEWLANGDDIIPGYENDLSYITLTP